MTLNIKKEFGSSRDRNQDMSTLVYGKIPPQAPELEEAVLGAIMLEKDKIYEVMAILNSPDCFYTPANQKIYAAIKSLHDNKMPIDLLTVTEELRKADHLEIIGGPYYLTNLTMNVSSSAHAEHHACIIREKFIARELIRICGIVIGKAYEDSTDIFDLADFATEQVLNAKMVKNTSDWKTVGEVLQELITHMDDVKTKPPGITTGFRKLDNEKMWFMPGDFIVLGARPSVGKSALMLLMVIAAARQGKKVGVISLEMMNKALFARMAGMESGVSYKQIYFNYVNEEKVTHLLKAMGDLGGLKIYFSDTAKVNANDIAAKAYTLKRKYGLDILFIDYLQLIEGERGKGRYEIVTDISRGLKTLALSMGIPIIALAQLNRESEANGRKPKMSDLRDSGGIEQDADGVMLLHRDWRAGKEKNEDGSSTEHEADLIIEKWRNGEPVTLKLHFDGPTMTFSDGQQSAFNFSDNPPPNPKAGMPKPSYDIPTKNDNEPF